MANMQAMAEKKASGALVDSSRHQSPNNFQSPSHNDFRTPSSLSMSDDPAITFDEDQRNVISAEANRIRMEIQAAASNAYLSKDKASASPRESTTPVKDQLLTKKKRRKQNVSKAQKSPYTNNAARKLPVL
mmetsp:Transcript_4527/g.6746  ORF Transcript_4527/g.6746 Transcript_4527/m.6746 type:complete len:131 (+) Transcript_4527:69-461(+)